MPFVAPLPQVGQPHLIAWSTSGLSTEQPRQLPCDLARLLDCHAASTSLSSGPVVEVWLHSSVQDNFTPFPMWVVQLLLHFVLLWLDCS